MFITCLKCASSYPKASPNLISTESLWDKVFISPILQMRMLGLRLKDQIVSFNLLVVRFQSTHPLPVHYIVS